MGQTLTLTRPKLRQDRLEALQDAVCDAADQMTDEQILALADRLHETLRIRRNLRGRVHDRVENRLCGRVADLHI